MLSKMDMTAVMKIVTTLILVATLIDGSNSSSYDSVIESTKGCLDGMRAECIEKIKIVLCQDIDAEFDGRIATPICCDDFRFKVSEACRKSPVIFNDNPNCKNNQSVVDKVKVLDAYCIWLDG